MTVPQRAGIKASRVESIPTEVDEGGGRQLSNYLTPMFQGAKEMETNLTELESCNRMAPVQKKGEPERVRYNAENHPQYCQINLSSEKYTAGKAAPETRDAFVDTVQISKAHLENQQSIICLRISEVKKRLWDQPA
ncbi:unnamed protein product [Schistocephalus solidus]|uniref:Uncharacterized protein n=1 Tax=Schistocephalus solidus TaxID=70667 RepID=A0A183T460_SCHSO|nr:unnamed protein product [Schistocephalus solidus]